MSRIDDLIQEFCPKGVEFEPLGAVGEFIRGNSMLKSDLRDSGFPAIHYGQVHTTYGTSAESTFSYVTPQFATRLRKAKPGDLVIATTSEDDEAVAKAVAWVGSTDVAVSGDAYIFRHLLEPKYVSYFFQSAHFQAQKKSRITGAKIRRISGESMAKMLIPVPPIEVQREIVRILDAFSRLESELEAELEARRKQYTFYRDQLLTLTKLGEQLTSMGELAVIGTGSRNTNEAVPNGVYPFFVRSQEPLAIDTYQFDETAIITAGDGVGVGKVFHYVDGKYGLHQRAYRIHVTSSSLVPKFLFYFIRNDFSRYLATTSVHASVTSLRLPMFQKYLVPVPPIAEQHRIVSILDKFDALVSDLSVGLPAELNARHRQYEHYRDRLLTFQEAV